MLDIEHLPSNREAAIAAQLRAHDELAAIYDRIREDSLRNVGGSAVDAYLFTANKIRADLEMIDEFSRQILPPITEVYGEPRVTNAKTIVDSLQEAKVVCDRGLVLWKGLYGYTDFTYPIGIKRLDDDYSQLLCAAPLEVAIQDDGSTLESAPKLYVVTAKTPLVAAYQQVVKEYEVQPFTQEDIRRIHNIKDGTYEIRVRDSQILSANETGRKPRKKHMTPDAVKDRGLMPLRIDELNPKNSALESLDFSQFDIERGMADVAFMFNKGDTFKKILEDRLAKEPTIE